MASPPRGPVPARIAEVAKLAGVSSATVSRTLANPAMVAEQTRYKVMEAVARSGYTPNAAARSLRARKSMMVLVVVPDIGNPFFAEVLRGIDETLLSAGYGLIIASLNGSAEKEERYASLALSGQVDGVLLLCGHELRGPKQRLSQTGLPTVAACETIAGVGFDQVEVTNFESATAAVRHLLELGHKRLAYLSGPPGNVLDKQRQAGFCAALCNAQLQPIAELMFAGDFSFRSGVAAANRIMSLSPEERPTAVFAANDEMAIGILKTLNIQGCRVPDDVSVIGFDGIDYADYCEPSLTTVVQPRREIGTTSASLLIELMRGYPHPARHIVLPCTLKVRDSTCPPPAAGRG